ncbi:TonB-dependent receptor [Chitinophaga nivalis]|uniref:TonB-dependent receptor n=1 Tax=Chitinophaga nivalis TaxID=2991709 RepID=A0ABT3IHI5_9BACT|nr:TonB-dependent receptor [Chitinophaga nivalis]MCW3466905.1 TonB-dependent receptor [Chitinophaga nivalis]MCW3483404.1 TonB-dependent receptor [Chitinophaga nivalis]
MHSNLLHHLRHPKKKIKPLLMLMLAAAPFTESFSAFSQALKHVVPGMEVKQGQLTNAIAMLEKKGAIKISFDQQALANMRVEKRSWKNETVARILSDLLSNTGLQFEERQNTIIIYPVSGTPAPASFSNLNQERKITGKVSDNSGPLVGAVVAIKGTTKGAITDAQGNFSINTGNTGDVVLTVSMIGYKTQEITYTGTPLNISLEISSKELNQVLVVGYGSQSKTKISGAITDVKLDKLSSRSVNSVAEALQGKAPGVTVQNQGGDPTSPPKVYIRGIGGINGEDPLYIVDGVIYNGLINPADIESISVLKDAAAAIYGMRASGGVVLITTKKGKAGKMTVNLDAKVGVQEAWKTLKVLNAEEFNSVMNQAADNSGKPRRDGYDATKNPYGAVTRTDWMKEIFRTAKVQEYNLDIAGGNDKSKYFIGMGYRKQDGILLNTFNERYNFRLNSDHQLNSWLKFGENMSYAYSNGNGANTTSAYTGAVIAAAFYTPSVTPYNPDGSFAGLPIDFAGSYGDVINPVAYLHRLDYKTPKSYLLINPYVEIKLPANLLFRSNLAFNKVFDNQKEFTSRVPEIGKVASSNNLRFYNGNTNDLLAEQTLTYTKQLNQHHIDAVAGYSYQKKTLDFIQLVMTGYDDERPGYRYPQNGSGYDKDGMNGGKKLEAMESFFARVNYDYKAKYLFTLLGRRDGSSLVAPQNRYQNYYSASAGWVITNEDFLKNQHIENVLSFLKLRASYGKLGNLGSLIPGVVDPQMKQTTSYFGQSSNIAGGYAEKAIANPYVNWANSKQLNMGLDAGFLNNQLTLTADYFVKTTDDMLLEKTPQPTDGVTVATFYNAGKVRDKGFELGLTYNNKPAAAFQYSINANISSVKNELLSLSGNDKVYNTSNINVRSSLTPVRVEVGHPLFSYYLVKTDGIFQTQQEVTDHKVQPKAQPGDLRFVDANGDGKIDNEDRQFVGTPYPKFSYGFSFNASYKGFDFNIFAQGVHGNKIFNALKYTGLAPLVTGQGYNLLADVKKAWTPENTNTGIPRVTLGDRNNNFGTNSDFYLEDGSYLRIKNISLGYTLPDALIARTGLKKLRVYVTGNNVFTFTKYSGMDPEVGTDNYGIDLGRYPQARSFLVGLNVNF